jgi:hypothetical protein
MSDTKYPLGPYRLVTVNNAPARAKVLIGRMVEAVKDKYTIIHAGNVDSKFSHRCHSFPIRSCIQPSTPLFLLGFMINQF